ncbi:MAG: hypothetical protein K8S13_09985 [Desulfobacula sp.]|uniref:hypothetical protein n=1 Tax=Desulfobacula sp. TaxID=2593537 RepID=UPI0025C38C76|nr:hypothetical protein [Desulfobacula sp.]MCD4720171.1 hypothetical protein [Desulfobacula sp.]
MATVNDVVLIYLEDAPVSFARVESILPDAKKDWYHIKLLMLKMPLQVVTWILKDDYINGQEFHMNGKKMKIKKVESPIENLPLSKPSSSPDKRKPGGKVPENIISFSDLKKNHEPESR